MSRRLRLLFPDDGTTSVAELLDDEAPKTCAALWDALPFEGQLRHAIWSGPETYLFIDATIRVAPENQSTQPLPGELGFYAVDGGRIVGWPEDIAEIAFFYGRGARPSMPTGPVAVNVFARIVENASGFARMCERVHREGFKTLRVEQE